MTDLSATHSDNSTTPPAAQRQVPFIFRGQAMEYFGIWIVNIVLTVLTLGIYSAWAKVRTKRYFYGSTSLDETSFEYHGKPLAILIGRLIAVGVLIVLNIITVFAPILAILFILVFYAGVPWIVMKSLKFNARVSSWRNIRFRFIGTYGGAAMAYLLWPFLGIITFGLLMPLAYARIYEYVGKNLSFGGRKFTMRPVAGEFYLTAILTLVIVVAVGLVLGLGLGSVMSLADPTTGFAIGPILGFYIAFFVGMVYFGTQATNIAVSALVLDNTHGLSSQMSPWRMMWITFTNLLAIAFTLGLMYPWTLIRLSRYRASKTTFLATTDLSEFEAQEGDDESAIGEELGEVFDLDIGF